MESSIILLHIYPIISKFAPSAFTPKTTTTFRFPDRGDWATQINRYARLPYVDATSTGATVVGNYRGNWSPYIPHNLIMRYTAPGELVLDQPDYPSGTGIHVCLRSIRVCALPKTFKKGLSNEGVCEAYPNTPSRGVTREARLGMAGSGTTIVECKLLGRRAVVWISIPMLSWWRAYLVNFK